MVLREVTYGFCVGAVLRDLPGSAIGSCHGERKLKPRVKTVLFLIVGNLVTALLVFAAVTTWREQGSRFGTIVLSLLSLGCVIFLVWAAIHGHRRGWKK